MNVMLCKDEKYTQKLNEKLKMEKKVNEMNERK